MMDIETLQLNHFVLTLKQFVSTLIGRIAFYIYSVY